MGLATNLNLIRLHDLLNGASNIAQSYIDACFPNTGVCSVLHSRQQIVVHRVERKRERRVDNPSYRDPMEEQC